MRQGTQNAFCGELAFQCGAALEALRTATFDIERFTAADRDLTHGNPYSIFRNLHSFLNHSANVSKLFWPIVGAMRKNESTADYEQRLPRIRRGRELRELFDITDTSVLLLRAMRDNIEHYDERLDKILDWWSENGDGQGIYDVMLIESEYIRKHGLPPHRMRQYDYNKKVFYFQGEELPLQPIEEELARIGMWAIGRK